MSNQALLDSANQFLGFSEGWKQTFLFNILDTKNGTVKLFGPNQAFQPAVGDKVNVCLPFKLDSEFLDQCCIEKVQTTTDGWICQGRLTHRTPLRYPLYFDAIRGEPSTDRQTVIKDNLLELLNDAKLTKKAIVIYFKHLIPFFSRVSRLCPDEHLSIEEETLGGVKALIEKNISNIEELEKEVRTAENPLAKDGNLIARYLKMLLPEVSEDMITDVYSTSLVPQYIKSIRLLEHKLCLNYNTVILLQHWQHP